MVADQDLLKGQGCKEGGVDRFYLRSGLGVAYDIGLVRDTDQKKSRSLEVFERSRRIRHDLQLRQGGRGMSRSLPSDSEIQNPVTVQEHGETKRFTSRTGTH